MADGAAAEQQPLQADAAAGALSALPASPRPLSKTNSRGPRQMLSMSNIFDGGAGQARVKQGNSFLGGSRATPIDGSDPNAAKEAPKLGACAPALMLCVQYQQLLSLPPPMLQCSSVTTTPAPAAPVATTPPARHP